MCNEWNGFRAFKIWTCCYNHFTKRSVDFTKQYMANKLFLKMTETQFDERNDAVFFHTIARKISEVQWVRLAYTNLMYWNIGAPYDLDNAIHKYNIFISRRDAFDFLLRHDYNVLNQNDVRCNDYFGIIRLLMRDLIAIETVVTLNRVVPITKEILKDKDHEMLVKNILKPTLLRVDKSNPFIHTSEEKLDVIRHNSFRTDNTFNTNIFLNKKFDF